MIEPRRTNTGVQANAETNHHHLSKLLDRSGCSCVGGRKESPLSEVPDGDSGADRGCSRKPDAVMDQRQTTRAAAGSWSGCACDDWSHDLGRRVDSPCPQSEGH